MQVDPEKLVAHLAAIERKVNAVIPENWEMDDVRPDYVAVLLDVLGAPPETDDLVHDHLYDAWAEVVDGKMSAAEWLTEARDWEPHVDSSSQN